jgi:hypothetical protein
MPTIVKRVSNACAQGTRWHATPNARRRKDQTIKISQNKEETTSQGWLIFTAVNWLSFIALQTTRTVTDAVMAMRGGIIQQVIDAGSREANTLRASLEAKVFPKIDPTAQR